MYNYNERDIAVIMNDNSTKKEAIKHLANGTIVYNSVSDWLDSNKANGIDDEDLTEENLRAGKIADISLVKYDGNEYVVEYVL